MAKPPEKQISTLIDPTTNRPFSSRSLDPDAVCKRLKNRQNEEIVEASKKLFRLAEFWQRGGVPKNIIDDLLAGAVILGEFSVGLKEGIVKINA